MGQRLFDVCLAGVALVISLPLWVAAAAWIKLDSPGPVLFRQQRVGRFGRTFEILKFRTMRVSASPSGDSLLTVGRDPRITRSGAFLRRFKLDEVPQFVNVLLGDMAVVGPRPEVPRYVAMYPPALREIVLSVRPGITDSTSLAYRDEAALLANASDSEAYYVEVVMPAKVEGAVRYVQTRSLRGDLTLIVRSVGVLIGR